MSFKFDPNSFESLTLPNTTRVPWLDPIAVYVDVSRPIERVRTHIPALDHDPSHFVEERTLDQTSHPKVRFVLCKGGVATPNYIKSFTPDGRLIGLFGGLVPYVDPEFRGRGIGAMGQYLHDIHLGRISASSYTPSGLRTRAAVHGLHVNAALREGRSIPDGVMADYEIQNGRAVLRKPYTPELHEDIGRRHKITTGLPRYQQLIANMMRDTSANVETVLGDNSLFEPDCHAFAIRAHRLLAGSQLVKARLTHKHSVHIGVLSPEKDRIIDIFGERPSDNFLDEVHTRFFGGPQKITVVRAGDVAKLENLFQRYRLNPLVEKSLVELDLIKAEPGNNLAEEFTFSS